MITERGHKIAIHIAFVALAVGVVLQSLLLPQAIGVNPGSNTTTHEESEKQLIDRRIADYTLGLAFFTGVLALSTIGLWVVTDLTLRHSRDTAERELRAYISHEPNGARMHPVTGDLCYFEYNFGQTPAKEVRMFLRVKDGADPRPISMGHTNQSILCPTSPQGKISARLFPAIGSSANSSCTDTSITPTPSSTSGDGDLPSVTTPAAQIGGTICGCGVTNTTMNTSARAMALGQLK